MSFVLIDKDNIVIQKSDSGEQAGFIPAPDDVGCGMIKEGNSYIRPPISHRFTPEEVLRSERKRLLDKTDWWATSDRTITDEQKAYRQELRDLPATTSPELNDRGELINITWPTKPTEES